MKVALVGTSPSSRMLAPYEDDSWQIWACSPDNAFGRLPRVSAWFEIHGDLEWAESAEWNAPAYVEWLREQTFPIYAIDRRVIPLAIPFPKAKMLEKFGHFFFTSTFAWAFALALARGATTIGLYGIDMAVTSEYAYQRSGLQHFIWLAAQTGVAVIAPDESDILQPPALYGFADATPMGRKLAVRDRELKGRVAQMEKQRAQLAHDIAFLEGAIEDVDYVRKTWTAQLPGTDGELMRISQKTSAGAGVIVEVEGDRRANSVSGGANANTRI